MPFINSPSENLVAELTLSHSIGFLGTRGVARKTSEDLAINSEVLKQRNNDNQFVGQTHHGMTPHFTRQEGPLCPS